MMTGSHRADDDVFEAGEDLSLDDATLDASLFAAPGARRVSPEWDPVLPLLRTVGDDDPSFPNDTDNHALILQNHRALSGVFARDLRRGQTVITRQAPFDLRTTQKYPVPISDTDITALGIWMVNEVELGWTRTPSRASLSDAIDLVASLNAFDPIKQYLEKLRWDGVPRLDGAAARYFGASDTEYARTVFVKWMISAVARTFTPGCQADHVMVLEGPQGIRKSSALRTLSGEQYFSDCLPDITSKEASEHLRGLWIVELGEVAQLLRTPSATMKAFITRRNDRYRKPYGHSTEDQPRRVVFAGTSNDSDYLSDASGNRRYWPLACGDVDLAALSADTDQLWAEACVRYLAGEPWHIIDEALLREARSQQDARRPQHPWEGLVVGYLDGKAFVTLAEVLTGPLGLEIKDQGRRGANDVRDILISQGWKQERESTGLRRRGFRSPLQSNRRAAAAPQTSGAEQAPRNQAAESETAPSSATSDEAAAAHDRSKLHKVSIRRGSEGWTLKTEAVSAADWGDAVRPPIEE
jgi:predicted P-loop ATPase